MDFLKWARIHWDRLVAVVAALAGAVALLIAWNGASRSAYPAEQLPYLLSGGLVGLFLFGVGATLWLSADLRDEWAELRGIRDELRAARTPPGPAGADVVLGAVSDEHVAEAPGGGDDPAARSNGSLARSERA